MKALYFLSIILLVASCAKVRETNLVPDGNQERGEKAFLTGLEPVRSNDVRIFSDYENRFNPVAQKQKGKIWFHRATVTNVSSYGGPLFMGYQTDMKAGYFKFNKNSLEFLNAVNPNRNDDGKLDTLLLSWDVDHSEYRYRESNGRPTNSLEEDKFIPWYKKAHFILDWAEDAKLVTPLEQRLAGCWKKDAVYLLPQSKVQEEGYFAFTKRVSYSLNLGNRSCQSKFYSDIRRSMNGNTTFQVEFTHSFKEYKVDSNSHYEPYVYNGEFDPLIQKYGYFKTAYEEEGEDGRIHANFLMNRWNPNKVHTFYFAPGFPEEYKWIYKTDPNKKDPYGKPILGVMDATNKVLEEAGIKMRFKIEDAPEGVRYGDLRYSFIKYMKETNHGGSPLGYGPSDANPFTGELISANSMVWTGGLKYYIQLIDEWIKRGDAKEGSAQSIYAEMNKIMGTNPEGDFLAEWQETARDLQHHTEAGHLFKRMLPDMTYGLVYWAPFTAGHLIDDQNLVTLPPESTDIFEFKDVSRLQHLYGRLINKPELKLFNAVNEHGREYVNEIRRARSQNDTTIYTAEGSLGGVKELLLEGKTPQEVIDTILYRVAIHEFGHNLNLRHNFYGSVDKNNFYKDEHLTVNHEDGSTEKKTYKQVSSSVMDYLSLQGEMHSSFGWEAYDKAAISYAYSTGKVDHSKELYPIEHPLAGEKKQFLYCTDEHRYTNALCNTWDLGTTPSEIILSLIDTYQKSYFTVNKRFNRAYWDTRGYESRIFGTMWDIKKFTMLDQSAFTYNNDKLSKVFKKLGVSKNEEEKYFTPIQRDIRRAIKISIAFYNSVLQQSNIERQYFSEYDEPTGALLRKGIFADKFFATYFLLGDDSFDYNPNIPVSYVSLLEYEDDPDIGAAIKKVSENLLTARVDSEPGFINFARLMYADSALNYYNQNNAELALRFKLTCYPPEKFNEMFGLNPYQYQYKGEDFKKALVADTLNFATDLPENSKVYLTEFHDELSDVGVAFIDGRVYAASKSKNQIAFNVIKKLREAYMFGDGDSGDRIGLRRQDIRDLRFLYKAMTGAEDYCL